MSDYNKYKKIIKPIVSRVSEYYKSIGTSRKNRDHYQDEDDPLFGLSVDNLMIRYRELSKALFDEESRRLDKNNPTQFNRNKRLASNEYTNKLRSDRNEIERRLGSLGVRVNKMTKSSSNPKFIRIEEGGSGMYYNSSKLKRMKLEVFEERAKGTDEITEAASDYLLTYLDMKINQTLVMEKGCDPDELKDLIDNYLDACRNDDSDEKEEMEEAIQKAIKAKECKKKLEELEDDLSEDEKEWMKELEEKIDNDESEDDDNDDDNDDEEKEESTYSEYMDEDKDLEMSDLANPEMESGLSDIAKMHLMDYITESVSDGSIDPHKGEILSDLILI